MAELMVHKVDMNKDGQLDFGEFIRIYRGLGNNYQVRLGTPLHRLTLTLSLTRSSSSQAGLKKIHTTEGKVRRATIKAAPAATVSKSAENANATAESEENANAAATVSKSAETANATAESEENANATAESEENAIKKVYFILFYLI